MLELTLIFKSLESILRKQTRKKNDRKFLNLNLNNTRNEGMTLNIRILSYLSWISYE